MREYTEIQERVMDAVWVGPPFWTGPCGHPGPSMVVDPDGTVRCCVTTSDYHEGGQQCANNWCLHPANKATSKCRQTKCSTRLTAAAALGQ